jgi:hypothetical protein
VTKTTGFIAHSFSLMASEDSKEQREAEEEESLFGSEATLSLLRAKTC